jgi:hypothetical protein
MARSQRRRGARIRPLHPVFFESTGHQGSATLAEVSYSGARLQVEQLGPLLGEPVRIYVWPTNHAEPFELVGHVVGLRDDGFAVEYEKPGQAICQWIDALQTAEAAPPPPAGERSGAGR